MLLPEMLFARTSLPIVHARNAQRANRLVRSTGFRTCLNAAWVCSLTLGLHAQETAPASNSTDSRIESTSDDLGDTVFLSPFEVDASKDAGWKSTNSTSGTSLNTPVKEIPMSIEVINKDFLDDTGATDFDEALQYSAGVVLTEFMSPPDDGSDGLDGPNSSGANEESSADRSPSSRGGLAGPFSNAANIRGFNVPFQNRDGFRYGGSIANYGIQLGGIIDTANVGRMEVIRGPNSLLYGIGVLSGIVNVIPKRPMPEPSYAFSFGMGNYGYMRGTFDLTGPLVRDVAGGFIGYRLGGALETRDDWTDYASFEKAYTMAQLMFQNERWNVFVEFQYADQQNNGIGDQFIYDNLRASIEPTYRNEYGEHFNWTRDLGGADASARITGPDTYHSREEFDFLANVDFTPIENLTLSAGVFVTDASEEVFDVNIATVNNEERKFALKQTIIPRPNDPNTENPEIWEDWINEFVDLRYSAETPSPIDNRDLRDFRTVRYWWSKEPLETTTQQVRLRGTYSFETADFVKDARMKHTFLLGYHYIKDEADFVTGTSTIARQFENKVEYATDDPLIFRSIHDQSPIRYNGEPLAQPGNQARNAEVWYDGYYGLYQGSLFNNNLGIIAGVRHDIYHARDREYDRFDDEAFWGDAWTGGNLSTAPSDGWTDNPDNLNIGFMPIQDGYSEWLPGPEPESATTYTFAANYRITSGLTVYGLLSEGLTPNTGERDGNLEGIPSEQTKSREIGLKFDVFERKLSGTISVYSIVRENAIWEFSKAPVPVNWVGGVDPDGTVVGPATSFEPAKIASGEQVISYDVSNRYFTNDGVDLGPITQIITDPITGDRKRVTAFPPGLLGMDSDAPFLDYANLDEPVLDRAGNANGKTWRHYLEMAFADRSHSTTGLRYVNGPEDYNPMWYLIPQGTVFGKNSSTRNAVGANVTYTDEATGLDFQLIYQPLPSWQVVFNYAHTERTPIEPFDLVEVVDPESGLNFGTEYDQWVRNLGRAAFGLEEHDDDGDGVVDRVTKMGSDEVLKMGDVPTSSIIGGIQGTNMYTGPEDTFSLFTKYSFLEGPIKGFETSMGVTYTGPAATSIPIGGLDLAENLYGTPPTPDRWNVNLGFTYKFNIDKYKWDVRLNIFNLLDTQKGETFAEYEGFNGETFTRRTVIYYKPRSYRLSLGLRF